MSVTNIIWAWLQSVPHKATCTSPGWRTRDILQKVLPNTKFHEVVKRDFLCLLSKVVVVALFLQAGSNWHHLASLLVFITLCECRELCVLWWSKKGINITNSHHWLVQFGLVTIGRKVLRSFFFKMSTMIEEFRFLCHFLGKFHTVLPMSSCSWPPQRYICRVKW